MSGMDQFLAEMYGTKTASAEDFEKQAQAEYFSKLAADNGIDLNTLSDEQVTYLWNQTFAKTAGDDVDRKVEEAKREVEEKRASAEKFAEADFLGRVMAHAYVQELNKIAADGEDKVDLRKHRPERGPAANEPSRGALNKRIGGAIGEGTIHSTSNRSHSTPVSDNIAGMSTAAGRETHNTGVGHFTANDKSLRGSLRQHAGAAWRHIKDHPWRYGGGAAAGAAALGGGALLAHHLSKKNEGKESRSSALDEIASEVAFNKAAEAGFQPEEAAQRLQAVLVLGLADQDNTKVAAGSSFEEAVEIRALELLEVAGYPVNW